MSLILKFDNDEDREKFLDLVERDKPSLVGQLARNPLLPHLYARTDSNTDAWLRERVSRFGEAFEDLKFTTFGLG